MAAQDIIVVGASAGGVDALQVLVAGFPASFNAAVFVVLHIGTGTNGQSFLPEILTKASAIPAIWPVNGEKVQQGRIYVAPPDYHMLLTLDHVHLSHGPKENRTRPAINPLFRSAALAYKNRVAGVVLTGMLDDGVAGLAEIQRHGGITVVQDPRTTFHPSMPTEAIRRIDVDYIVPLPDISTLLSDLATNGQSRTAMETSMEKVLIGLTCPECRGPLWKERNGNITEYRCRVGHAYSPLALSRDHQDTVERTLWSTVVALEESADIADELSQELGIEYTEKAKQKRAQAALIKSMFHKQT